MKTKLHVSDLFGKLSEEERTRLAQYEDQSCIRKSTSVEPEPEIPADTERTSLEWISTRDLDRDGEIVDPQGAVLDEYQRNPVVFVNHNRAALPVGRSLSLEADDYGVKSLTEYAETPEGNDVWTLKQGGFLPCNSIGFIVLNSIENDGTKSWEIAVGEYRDKWGVDIRSAKRIINEWLLLEYSVVGIPANPNALQIAVSKGLVLNNKTLDMLGIKTQVEEDDDEYSPLVIPVRDEPIIRPRRVVKLHKPEDVRTIIKRVVRTVARK